VSAKTCRQCGAPILIGADGLCADCVNLRDKPDTTATRTQLHGVPFKDMKQIDEADRFKMIAGHLKANPGKNVAVMVESGGKYEGKGDRYIAGVQKEAPEATVVKRGPGLVSATETIIFRI
jgi:hypothetical protein